MRPASPDVLRSVPLYARLGEEDLASLAAVAEVGLYTKGQRIFVAGDPSEHFYTIVRGRVKICRERPTGRELILAILGGGDPVGAVAVYQEIPFPAAAEALEDTVVVRIPRGSFYELIERQPGLVRGLLMGMTARLVELTNRLATLTGGRVEARFARLFLKLHDDIGRPGDGGVLIPIQLTRQELADLTGTTIETAIRIMSRWNKNGLVATTDEGFVVPDPTPLRSLAVEGAPPPE